MGPRVALVCALMAGPAVAACPVPGDLDRGIRITYEDGDTEVFRRVDALNVETRYADGADTLRDLLVKGLFLVQSAPVSSGAPDDTIVVKYPVAPGDLPTPAPGMTFDFTVADTFGADTFTVQESYTTTSLQQVTIGGCVLRVFDVKLRRDDGINTPSIERIRYLADFGFGYVSGLGDEGAPMERYPLRSLEAVE